MISLFECTFIFWIASFEPTLYLKRVKVLASSLLILNCLITFEKLEVATSKSKPGTKNKWSIS